MSKVNLTSYRKVKSLLAQVDIAVAGGIAFVAATTPVGGSAGITSINATLPTASDGNIRFIALEQVLTNSVTTPTGWTLIGTSSEVSSQVYAHLFYRVKQAGDSDTVTINFGGTVVAGAFGFAFSGQAASPIGNNSITNNFNQNSPDIDPSSFNVTAADSTIIVVASGNSGASTVVPDATQTGYTTDARGNTGSGNYGSWYVGHYTGPASGNTNPLNITTSGGGQCNRQAIAFELKKA